jgi:hypothetical protein
MHHGDAIFLEVRRNVHRSLRSIAMVRLPWIRALSAARVL